MFWNYTYAAPGGALAPDELAAVRADLEAFSARADLWNVMRSYDALSDAGRGDEVIALSTSYVQARTARNDARVARREAEPFGPFGVLPDELIAHIFELLLTKRGALEAPLPFVCTKFRAVCRNYVRVGWVDLQALPSAAARSAVAR